MKNSKTNYKFSAGRGKNHRLVEASTASSEPPESEVILEVMPLRDQVSDIVRRMILRGKLKPNEQISERQISQQLGISVTPVKEAFRILQAEGLILSKSRVGSFVSRVPRNQMIQIVSMRGALEGVAAHFAAVNRTGGELADMAACLGEVRALLAANGDLIKVAAHNAVFHKILRCASRNEYLVNLILTMRSIDRTFREMSLEIDKDEPSRAFKEHSNILDAVKKGDSELAERLMNGHIRRVANSIMNISPE